MQETARHSSKGLADQLARNIEQLITEEVFPVGTPLVERALAERFRVSRSPIREALRILAQRSILGQRPEGGYFVQARPQGSAFGLLTANEDEEEKIYLKIGEDRLAGVLPERVTESDLMRRYAVTKTQLGSILQRIGQEGWIERLPGHGWQFLPILTSSETYDQGYRFRILIESAALLEPDFKVDEAALRKCLAEQQALIDGAVEWASPAQLFDANARLHETIAGFSGNVFILDSLKRINRLRRLMEYRKVVDRAAAARRCREHRTLIELLLAGQQEAAADFIRLHLRDAAREKSEKHTPHSSP
ncbi:GntR family transcriptional regulator [Alicycliphilus denitrificans]|uniref:GntR family transcriptional regulator n=1 Tax=Alicycliphilus denitrificans TaxID=179636 RepID=A0A420K9M3_9BURK|nr:GntR family transcriptional regulator [Alicycliphilus denitrificans]RKJ95426.1 GntR family transcriptional regulator [Alicycliphilus denitrificans]